MTATFDASLLPPPGESERCAVHAERIALDPGGSALSVDELIVVDVPLPWPKPVWAKAGFTAVPELVLEAGQAGRRVRVLAAVPLTDGIGRVITHRLEASARFVRHEHHVEPVEVAGLLTSLLTDGLGAADSSIVDTAPRRELLLCTQGSHDVCCGSIGATLEKELFARGWYAIRRVSHTGGHRMAPTGVTLPDGRMWGMVSADEMLGILRHEISPSEVAPRCRGWIGVEAGPAQMAERAVFAAIDDWGLDDTTRTVAVAAVNDGHRADIHRADIHRADIHRADVQAAGHRWSVEVEAGRAVPTIACGAPGGLPAKPGAEWRVTSISSAE